LGSHLRKLGKLGFGVVVKATNSETNRGLFRNELSNVGLPVTTAKIIKGITELQKYLNPVLKIKWVKLFILSVERWRPLNILI
jgi:hypothetical protein